MMTIQCCNRWVCQDHPELKPAVGHLLDSYDRDKYESMANVVDAYNKAVNMQLLVKHRYMDPLPG